MLDFDAIAKARRFETVTISATMPGSAAELVNGLLTRFEGDPEKLEIVKEMILTEGSRAVLAQIGGESKPPQARRGRKPKAVAAEAVKSSAE